MIISRPMPVDPTLEGDAVLDDDHIVRGLE